MSKKGIWDIYYFFKKSRGPPRATPLKLATAYMLSRFVKGAKNRESIIAIPFGRVSGMGGLEGP